MALNRGHPMPSLPPRVCGPVQGQLILSITTPPDVTSSLRLQINLWGCENNTPRLQIPSNGTPAILTFPICAKPASFLQYLHDMGTLRLHLTSTAPSDDVSADCAIDVRRLSPQSPCMDEAPLKNRYGRVVGHFQLSISLILPSWRPEVQAADKMKREEVAPKTPLNVFIEFDKALGRQHLRLIDVLRACDKENSGVFTEATLDAIFQRVLKSIVPLSQKRICWIMINRSDSDQLTFAEFCNGFRKAKQLCHFAVANDHGVLQGLHRISRQSPNVVAEIMEAMKRAKAQETLNFGSLISILREVIPSLTHKEERLLLACLAKRCSDEDITFEVLQSALHLEVGKLAEAVDAPKGSNIPPNQLQSIHTGGNPAVSNAVMVSGHQSRNNDHDGSRPCKDIVRLPPFLVATDCTPAHAKAASMDSAACSQHHAADGRLHSGDGRASRGSVASHQSSLDELISRAEQLLLNMSESCRNGSTENMCQITQPKTGDLAYLSAPNHRLRLLGHSHTTPNHLISGNTGTSNSDTLTSQAKSGHESVVTSTEIHQQREEEDTDTASTGPSESFSSLSIQSEDAKETEEKLLGSLFFPKSDIEKSHNTEISNQDKEAPPKAATSVSPVESKQMVLLPSVATEPNERICKPHDTEVDQLRLVLDRIACIDPQHIYAILRSPNMPPMRVNLCDDIPAADVLLPQPNGIAASSMLDVPLILVLEVRKILPCDDAGHILGIARIPLVGNHDPLAEGSYELRDVVSGHCNGEVSATVWTHHPHTKDPHDDGSNGKSAGRTRELSSTEVVGEAVSATWKPHSLRMVSLSGLLDEYDYHKQGIQPPQSYYLQCKFPGEATGLTTEGIPIKATYLFPNNTNRTIQLSMDTAKKCWKEEQKICVNGSIECQLYCRWGSGAYQQLYACDVSVVSPICDLGTASIQMTPCNGFPWYHLSSKNPVLHVTIHPPPKGYDATRDFKKSTLDGETSEDLILTTQGDSKSGGSECYDDGDSDDDNGRAMDPIDSMVCVEVLACTGLQTAVEEAQEWMGGDSCVLGKAHQLGPNPFVTVSLFPALETLDVMAPMVQTPFQAQSFCPVYHHKKQFALQLNPNTMKAIAEENLTVEVWHHCSRAHAIAAALSEGKPTLRKENQQRDVFLGASTAPLHQLLAKPQGIRGWMLLKSRRQNIVGAVQLSVHLSSIDHKECDAKAEGQSPIEMVPQLLRFLGFCPQGPILGSLQEAGMDNPWVYMSIHLEAMLFSQSKGDSRPPSGPYHAVYQLPGSRSKFHTCPEKAAACGLNLSIGMGGKWRVDWQHTEHHWVKSGTRTIQALLAYPLGISVFCHSNPPARKRPQAGKKYTEAMGHADVDLSSLLQQNSHQKSSHERVLSGVYSLVKPGSKHMHTARVKVRVVLDPLNPSHPNDNPNASLWEISPMLVPDSSESDSGSSDAAPTTKRPLQQQVLEKQRRAGPISRMPKRPVACLEHKRGPEEEVETLCTPKTVQGATEQPVSSDQEQLQEPKAMASVGDEVVQTSSRRETISMSEDDVALQVSVEGVMHMTMDDNNSAGVFVAYHLKDCEDVFTTKVSAVCGDTGGFAAEWSECTDLIVPSLSLNALILEVWSCDLNVDTKSQSFSSLKSSMDLKSMVGSSNMDLTTLKSMGEVSGWYNLWNQDKLSSGQIKVTVSMDDGSTAIDPEPTWTSGCYGNISLSNVAGSSVPHCSMLFDGDKDTLQKQLRELEALASSWTKRLRVGKEENEQSFVPSDDENSVLFEKESLTDSEDFDCSYPMVFPGAVSEDDEEPSCKTKRESPVKMESRPQPFQYDNDWMFEISTRGSSMPANIDKENIPESWKTSQKDCELGKVVPKCDDISMTTKDQFSSGHSSVAETIQIQPGSAVVKDSPSLQNRESGQTKLEVVSSSSASESSSESPKSFGSHVKNVKIANDIGAAAAGYQSSICEKLSEDDDGLECSKDIPILRVSLTDMLDAEVEPKKHFRNTLPSPGSNSPIQYSDAPTPFQSVRNSTSVLRTSIQSHSQEGSDNDAPKSSQATTTSSVDQQNGRNDNSSMDGFDYHTVDHLQSMSQPMDPEHAVDTECLLPATSAQEISTDFGQKGPEVATGASGSHISSYNMHLKESLPETMASHVERPYVPAVSLACHTHQSASFTGPCGVDVPIQTNVPPSVGAHCFGDIPHLGISRVNPTPLFSSPGFSFPSNMCVNAPVKRANPPVGLGMEGLLDEVSKQNNDFSSLPDVSSVLDKYKIARKPGWWKSLLSDEAQDHLEPGRPTVKKQEVAHMANVPPEIPEVSSRLQSVCLGVPTQTGNIVDDRSIANSLHSEGNQGGEKENFVNMDHFPPDSHHLWSKPSGVRDASRRKYLDKETERIARIMTSKQTDQ